MTDRESFHRPIDRSMHLLDFTATPLRRQELNGQEFSIMVVQAILKEHFGDQKALDRGIVF